MIHVSLTLLIFIYLGLSLAVVFGIWMIAELRRGRREKRALQFVVHCVLCAFKFEDKSSTLLPRCPRCGSLNERFKTGRI